MSKTQYLRSAAAKLDQAIEKLQRAKADLLRARSDQHIRLALALVEIEEIYNILTDPVCTPEITDADLDEIRDKFYRELTRR